MDMKVYGEAAAVFFLITAVLLFPLFGAIHILTNGAVELAGFFIALEIALILLAILVVSKKRRKLLLILSAVCAAAGLATAMPYFYKESLATVKDAEVDLYGYQPFTQSEKLARLDHPASLELVKDVPHLDGATALYPLYAAFAEAVYPEKSYDAYASEIRSSTTPEAYSRLIKGEADVIFAAGPSDSQKRTAEQAGVNLKLTPIGREAFVFFVNAQNDVDNLSSEDIRRIYAGDVTNWRELGGSDDEIRPFQRPDGSGSQTAFINFMGNIPIQEPETEDVASGMGGIINEVASYRNYKNAIGYTFRFYSTEMVRNEKIKLIGVDGVEPAIGSIRSGEYPLVSEFYAITADSVNPHIQPFLDWIVSPEGQKLVEKTGFVSMRQ